MVLFVVYDTLALSTQATVRNYLSAQGESYIIHNYLFYLLECQYTYD